jgi:hypothetical protein
MKDYVSVPNITNAFPSVIAKNSSGAGATDGTGLVADWLNNDWGFKQMLMSRAGLTPSGSLEAYSVANAFSHTVPGQVTITLATAQILQALQYHFGSPGELVLWCRSQAPGTVGARVLLLQGQTLAVASYPDLCNAVYVGDALNNTVGVPFYLSSDNGGVTRSTTGAYLTLPDARGVTIRGIDTAQARDPLGNSRGGAAGAANGSVELDAEQAHWHDVVKKDAPTNFWIANANGHAADGAANGGVWQATSSARFEAQAMNTDGATYEGKVNAAVRLAVETRMINMACYIGIRF